MTPKEKAIELFDKMHIEIYNRDMYDDLFRAKQCALIAVDEILELKETQEEYQIQYDNGEWSRELGYRYSKYWQEVKQEIEAL
jgi:hypothetical protein